MSLWLLLLTCLILTKCRCATIPVSRPLSGELSPMACERSLAIGKARFPALVRP